METMNLDQFIQLILPSLKQRLEKHEGLPVFAQQRAKFEGWLKVELCGILLKHFPDTLPEKGRTDLTGGGWAIELKTFSTNYRHKGVVNKIRPITNNIAGVCKDIEKLKKVNTKNKMVIFVAFPLDESNKGWFTLLNRIQGILKEIRSYPFTFSGDIPGIIYFGLV